MGAGGLGELKLEIRKLAVAIDAREIELPTFRRQEDAARPNIEMSPQGRFFFVFFFGRFVFVRRGDNAGLSGEAESVPVNWTPRLLAVMRTESAPSPTVISASPFESSARYAWYFLNAHVRTWAVTVASVPPSTTSTWFSTSVKVSGFSMDTAASRPERARCRRRCCASSRVIRTWMDAVCLAILGA